MCRYTLAILKTIKTFKNKFDRINQSGSVKNNIRCMLDIHWIYVIYIT